MNGILASTGLGAMALAAVAAMSGPPTAEEKAPQESITRQFFITRQIDTAEPIEGRWEANLPPVGQLTIVVDEKGKRVTLNGEALSPDRVIWQPHNLVMLIDEARRRQFEVVLGENGRITSVRPNSWLEYRGSAAPRVAIGIYTDPVPAPLAAQLGIEADQALLVSNVVQDMPAFKSGVLQFDVITAVDDEQVVNQNTLKNVVLGKEPGQTIQLRLIRQARPLELSVEVAKVEPLDPGAVDPIFSLPNGPGEIRIDAETFSSPDLVDWTFTGSGARVIRFENDDAILVPTVAGRFGEPGNVQSLQAEIRALTARITSLEAMIAQLLTEQRGSVKPAGIDP
ncbi:MAG: PDZ domain-containing protein [Phycisphaerales bacterium]|nr:PDZ domain-containing protein [Phycisphaerales bacterium]